MPSILCSAEPGLLVKPDYPLWYTPAYPIQRIQYSHKQEWSHKTDHLPALLAHIREHGLINPLIILNHRDPSQYKARYVMTGTNRLWCVKQLGWKTVPAIVTGDCDVPATRVEWEHIDDYFPDGEVYLGSQGPRIRGYSNFLLGEFPCSAGKFGGAQGPS
jgi:hypothetical protein